MAKSTVPETKPFLDMGDPNLARSIAVALNALGLVDVGGTVAEFVDLGSGIVAMRSDTPFGFMTDGYFVLTLTNCGPYDGDWSVQSNSPTELVPADMTWQGPHTGGRWKIKQQVT